MAAAALVVSIVAIIVPTLVWLLDKQDRDRDRTDRAAEREQDRAERATEREAEAAERQRLRDSMRLDVTLVSRESVWKPRGQQSSHGEHWFRVSLVGGDAYSAVEVTRLARMRGDQVSEPDMTHGEVPFVVSAQRPRYFHGAPNSVGSIGDRVHATWHVDGGPERTDSFSVTEQPW